MKTKNKVVKMTQKRRLSDDMITVHNKINCRSITFNPVLSLFLKEQKFDMAELSDFEGRLIISFFRMNEDKRFYPKLSAKLSYNSNNPSASLSSIEIVSEIFKHHNLPEGDFYFKISNSPIEEGAVYGLYSIEIEGVLFIPTNEIQVTIENNDNFINKVSLDKATDQQLWDELKRRGYEGEVTKHMK